MSDQLDERTVEILRRIHAATGDDRQRIVVEVRDELMGQHDDMSALMTALNDFVCLLKIPLTGSKWLNFLERARKEEKRLQARSAREVRRRKDLCLVCMKLGLSTVKRYHFNEWSQVRMRRLVECLQRWPTMAEFVRAANVVLFLKHRNFARKDNPEQKNRITWEVSFTNGDLSLIAKMCTKGVEVYGQTIDSATMIEVGKEIERWTTAIDGSVMVHGRRLDFWHPGHFTQYLLSKDENGFLVRRDPDAQPSTPVLSTPVPPTPVPSTLPSQGLVTPPATVPPPIGRRGIAAPFTNAGDDSSDDDEIRVAMRRDESSQEEEEDDDNTSSSSGTQTASLFWPSDASTMLGFDSSTTPKTPKWRETMIPTRGTVSSATSDGIFISEREERGDEEAGVDRRPGEDSSDEEENSHEENSHEEDAQDNGGRSPLAIPTGGRAQGVIANGEDVVWNDAGGVVPASNPVVEIDCARMASPGRRNSVAESHGESGGRGDGVAIDATMTDANTDWCDDHGAGGDGRTAMSRKDAGDDFEGTHGSESATTPTNREDLSCAPQCNIAAPSCDWGETGRASVHETFSAFSNTDAMSFEDDSGSDIISEDYAYDFGTPKSLATLSIASTLSFAVESRSPSPCSSIDCSDGGWMFDDEDCRNPSALLPVPASTMFSTGYGWWGSTVSEAAVRNGVAEKGVTAQGFMSTPFNTDPAPLFNQPLTTPSHSRLDLTRGWVDSSAHAGPPSLVSQWVDTHPVGTSRPQTSHRGMTRSHWMSGAVLAKAMMLPCVPSVPPDPSAHIFYCSTAAFVRAAEAGVAFTKPVIIKASADCPRIHSIETLLASLEECYGDAPVEVQSAEVDHCTSMAMTDFSRRVRAKEGSIAAVNLFDAFRAQEPVITMLRRFQLLDNAVRAAGARSGERFASSRRLSQTRLQTDGAFTGPQVGFSRGSYVQSVVGRFECAFIPPADMDGQWDDFARGGSNWRAPSRRLRFVLNEGDVVLMPHAHVFALAAVGSAASIHAPVWDTADLAGNLALARWASSNPACTVTPPAFPFESVLDHLWGIVSRGRHGEPARVREQVMELKSVLAGQRHHASVSRPPEDDRDPIGTEKRRRVCY